MDEEGKDGGRHSDEGGGMSPRRVLVVEDNEQLRSMLASYLVELGHEVRDFGDAESALAAFDRDAADVLITDLGLPGMGGVELVGILRERAPELVVLVLSGTATLKSAGELMRQGCDDLLIKPLPHLEQLGFALQRALERRDALLVAGLCKRIIAAKDEVLQLFSSEFAGRLVELQHSVDELREVTTRRSYRDCDSILDRMRAILADGVEALLAAERSGRELESQRLMALEPRNADG